MLEDEYELDEMKCPQCGHSPTHSRRCFVPDCIDGWIDLYEEDPFLYDKNDLEMCTECWGTGIERWCPKCSFDLQRPRPTATGTDLNTSGSI